MPGKKLKHNPKLDKTSEKKKRSSYQKEVDSYKEARNYSRFYMMLVFIGVVSVISILVLVVFTQSGIRIHQYDLVRMDYKIYSLSEYQNHQNPSIEEMNTWVNVCSRYDEKCGNGLIKGFYYELLGKREGDFLNNKLIVRCQDGNWDGYNDLDPTQEALSFGNSSDLLYDTDIVLWFKIYQINSSSTIESQTHFSCKIKEIHQNYDNNLINYILIIKRDERDFFINYISHPIGL